MAKHKVLPDNLGVKPELASRIAPNALSTRKKRFWRLTLIFLLLATSAVVAAYLYLAREKPLTYLTVAAGPYRSDSHELMKEVADVVQRQSDRLRLTVIPTPDSSTNISKLNVSQVDLATIRSDTPVGSDIRMVSVLFPDYFSLITKTENGFFSVRDLEGKKIAIPPFGTDEFRSFWAVADHYDLSISDTKWEALPFAVAAKRFIAGEIDAIFTVRSLRDRLLLNLFEDAALKRQDLTLIEIDQAPAIAIKRPFLGSEIVPKGTFGGFPVIPRRDIVTSSVTRTLVTREDVDPEMIRELTSILFENRLDLTIRFALASAIQQPDISKGLSIPLHDGAKQYYDRDAPSFLQENAEPIALIITIAAMLGSGLLALRSRFNSGQKNRMDSYNYVLLDIAERARIETGRTNITAMKAELFGVLEKVVRALDTDEVTEEGFQSFSLLWESVRELINDRERELISPARPGIQPEPSA